MGWQIEEDPENWLSDMPVFTFATRNAVVTKMGTKDSDGRLRLFLIKLNDLKGITDCIAI